MSTTIVHFVRHGEVFNPDKILYGRIPGYHLSSRGHSMAVRTAQAFEGHEAIVVSHQLPIVMVQRTVLGKRLAHAPWNRECDLASVTSLVYRDRDIVDIFYSSPAQDI